MSYLRFLVAKKKKRVCGSKAFAVLKIKSEEHSKFSPCLPDSKIKEEKKIPMSERDYLQNVSWEIRCVNLKPFIS